MLVFCDQWKILSDLNMSHGKFYVTLSDFISFSLFGFNLVIKLRNVDFKSHWSTSIDFYRKKYDFKFKYASWKNV